MEIPTQAAIARFEVRTTSIWFDLKYLRFLLLEMMVNKCRFVAAVLLLALVLFSLLVGGYCVLKNLKNSDVKLELCLQL